MFRDGEIGETAHCMNKTNKAFRDHNPAIAARLQARSSMTARGNCPKSLSIRAISEIRGNNVNHAVKSRNRLTIKQSEENATGSKPDGPNTD